MLKHFSKAFCLVGFLSIAALVANGQEVVHALAGVVSSIHPSQKTIDVKTDDGSDGLFKDNTGSNVSLDFDKEIRSAATPAGDFQRTGANVIVYYFSHGDDRTAVALEDLGQKPIQKFTGTVVKFNRHERLLSIKDASGTIKEFQIGPQTVAEGPMGAVEAQRFDPEKGDPVRVTATPANGNEEALFIRAD
ncbi:MAG TPA: hypothetical protein VMB49_18785 [Acidobacteriaceae bacterium]|nr:hypothetical protein [Acidobacteriaceae bacterium]